MRPVDPRIWTSCQDTFVRIFCGGFRRARGAVSRAEGDRDRLRRGQEPHPRTWRRPAQQDAQPGLPGDRRAHARPTTPYAAWSTWPPTRPERIPIAKWTTSNVAARKRANAVRQLLKQPAAQFPRLPRRRLAHPAGHGLNVQLPQATPDSRTLMTSVPGRLRICALVQACNGRLSRNREMPDEVSILSLRAGSHQGLCQTCHGVPPAGLRRCCP